ncbi:MAG: NADH-quinone oxidoreductase subunit J [Nitrospinae bacterium]|nr:NADH-quinone oxidoreductase subunit J [Nitrospinota bacterium]MBF0634733.1 NADH-quinone oxidoreductase subunit J [Nitrospinota bacterium]
MEILMFNLLGGLSVALALGAIISKRPVNSAINLIGTMFCLAGLFAMQDAHLIAALQVLVYAGAIMALFLFVIMLLNVREKVGAESRRQPYWQLLAVVSAGALFVPLVTLGGGKILKFKEAASGFGTTAAVGRLLYTDYILPFEIASVLLLAALVGAVILTKTKIR